MAAGLCCDSPLCTFWGSVVGLVAQFFSDEDYLDSSWDVGSSGYDNLAADAVGGLTLGASAGDRAGGLFVET